MCEHGEQLQRAAYELDRMWGRGEISYPRLRQLLNQEHDEKDHG